MRLRAIEMENIRSYRHAAIDFPDGITLLSGDIGSGKSTLLIAAAFALFGLQRGELTGAALLRHDSKHGKVIVVLETHGVVYRICRTLKRTSNSIVQDTGWLEREGQREELTANELKAKVFEILGYPLQFLQRKNLLYTFTVYARQEEMKSILSQQPQERIETIRRVFGVDAYKTMRDNAQVVARELKNRGARMSEIAERLREEQERLQERIAAGNDIASRMKDNKKKRSSVAQSLRKTEEQLDMHETSYRKMESERQIAAMNERTRKNLHEEIVRLQQKVDAKRTAFEAQKKTLSEMIVKLEKMQVRENPEEPLRQSRERVSGLEKDEGRIIAIMEQCETPDVQAGQPCPLCRQHVGHEHLGTLEKTLSAKLEAARRKRKRIKEDICKEKERISFLESQLEECRTRTDLERRIRDQQENILREKENLSDIEETLQKKQQSLKEIPEQAVFDEQAMQALAQDVRQTKSTVVHLREQLLVLEKEAGQIEQEQKEILDAQKRLEGLRKEMQACQNERQFAMRTKEWMQDKFASFTTLVEQRVLLTIHSTFDAAFREWFAKLVEDDALCARLDQEFSPLVEQNGYETDVSFLSGGERTAVALAYRLAFVHTIHTLLPDLGTAGVIMLDEPTDGFSAEQLARMQDVLRELDMDQVILVSHEEQLEAFADNIIRVVKQDGLSLLETKAL